MTEAIATDLPRWRAVRNALDEFQRYMSPQVPPFQTVAAYDYDWNSEEYKRRRPQGFPSRLHGVYLIYNEQNELLYVGAALFNFDKRVWSHDSTFTSCEAQPRWIDIIPLAPAYAFLGLSLEYFLICRLKPKCNKSYKGYQIPVTLCENAEPPGDL